MNCKTNADIVFYFSFAFSACLLESKDFLHEEKATDTSTNDKNENLEDMPCYVLYLFYSRTNCKKTRSSMTLQN